VNKGGKGGVAALQLRLQLNLTLTLSFPHAQRKFASSWGDAWVAKLREVAAPVRGFLKQSRSWGGWWERRAKA